jgi:hypothetical protein
MKKAFFILSILAVFIVVALVACQDSSAGKETATAASKKELEERGAYLALTMMCDDCHSPKRMGAHGPEIIPELRLSGFRQNGQLPSVDSNEIKKGWTLFNEDLTSAVGPWGASFSANLTSDETGIGNWSEEQFFKAIREGKLKGLDGSRPLLPPMPWQNIRNLTDNDLRALFTFLKSTKPVQNVVPGPKSLAELK